MFHGAVCFSELLLKYIIWRTRIEIIMNSKYSEALLTLKNAGPFEIPAFPSDVLEKAIQELNEANSELRDLRKKQRENPDMSEDEKVFVTAKTVVKIDTIYRLKRFMLVMLENRNCKIEKEFWNYGGQVKPSQLTNMSVKQKGYLLGYKSLINNYIDEVGLELMMDFEPPIDTIVEIRVINDCGEILQLSEQGVRLEKNSVHFIQKRLVEKLILKGDVAIIG